jgi:endonuclease/exonuclease/phosphatase family metal-dependent hydrolase
MRLFSLLLSAIVVASGAFAQDVPPRGDDATFDVATWNIENFGSGSGGTLQRQNVVEVIRDADVDLWALQEIVDVNDFTAVLQELLNDGYRGVLGPDPGGGGQRLAYIYDEAVVTVIATRTILSGNEFNFAGRLPLEMLANVTVNGRSQSLRLINFHAKCCGDRRSYDRRVAAATELKEYTDDQVESGRTVLLLGDFNDGLNLSTAGGLSPYRPYRQDTDTYTIATRDLDDDDVPTFCSNSSCTSGSTLDHLLFSNDLAASYIPDSGDRYIELVSAISGYTSTTSDHLPVVASFTLVSVSGEAAPEASGVALRAPQPNPTRGVASLLFRLDAPGPVRLDVFDARGRRVAGLAGTYAAGEHAVDLDTAPLAPGVYAVRLAAGGAVATQTFVRAR